MLHRQSARQILQVRQPTPWPTSAPAPRVSLLTPTHSFLCKPGMSCGERLAEFVGWAQHHITGDEKGQAQIFLDRFFQAFGQPGVLEVGGQLRASRRRGGTRPSIPRRFIKQFRGRWPTGAERRRRSVVQPGVPWCPAVAQQRRGTALPRDVHTASPPTLPFDGLLPWIPGVTPTVQPRANPGAPWAFLGIPRRTELTAPRRGRTGAADSLHLDQ